MLYPLRFRPRFRNYLWGGRRLESVLKKPLGEGEHFAESWEVVDHGADQSEIEYGPLAGRTLGEVREQFAVELFGQHAPQRQFPLLFKYLDAQQNLSVQVHPNDEQAARLDPPDLGKTEAWVVVHCEPGAKIYAGLKRGFDRAAFAREVRRNTAHLCLHSFEPRPGDCVFVPAGAVHALGAGLVIAEIQQASDTTFRLYDWNRVGPDGQPRPLHIDDGLAVLDERCGPIGPVEPQETERPWVSRLVACDKFVLDRWQFSDPRPIGGDDRFHIVSVLEGEVHLSGDPAGRPLERGQTALIPAALQVIATPMRSTTMLEMYLPEKSS